MKNIALIGMGSNIRPRINIRTATARIKAKFRVMALSRPIQTKPVGYRPQADFINRTAILRTELSLPKLKRELKELETELGRKRSKIKFGPRTIDLDVVVWNGKVIDRDIYTRPFLQKLTLELMPELKSRLFT